MAEAYQAVGFSFQITEGGVSIDFNKDALQVLKKAAKYSLQKRGSHLINRLINTVYPFHHSIWLLLVMLYGALAYAGLDLTYFGGVRLVDSLCQRWLGMRRAHFETACFLVSLLVFLVGIFLTQWFIQWILSYTDWIHEMGRPKHALTLRTKLFLAFLRVLRLSKAPRLLSYQNFLPKLPLPALDDTIARYLESVRALFLPTTTTADNAAAATTASEEFEKLRADAVQFRDGEGRTLQRMLRLKHWMSSNYVSDWWEDYVYLASRNPLMINSNFYGIDCVHNSLQHRRPTARAAHVVYFALQHRANLERQRMRPQMINGLVPLCSAQYDRLFNTTRVPHPHKDAIAHARTSIHIVVMSGGRYYRVPVVSSSLNLLPPAHFQRMFEQILKDSAAANQEAAEEEVSQSEKTTNQSNAEARLFWLTAGNRDNWARARQLHFGGGGGSRSVNRQSLTVIEQAAFVVSLDALSYVASNQHEQQPANQEQQEQPANQEKPRRQWQDLDAQVSTFAKEMLGSATQPRWYDKSFTLVVGRNGRIGFNAEHSWGDAPIMSMLWEFIVGREFLVYLNPEKCEEGGGTATTTQLGYGPAGNCLGYEQLVNDDATAAAAAAANDAAAMTTTTLQIRPTRLHWKLDNPDLLRSIDESRLEALNLIRDLDLNVTHFDLYGKGFAKKVKTSPDAFIQLALQLAYYTEYKRFCLTYEASMTRIFLEGRTETARSCTEASVGFCRALMELLERRNQTGQSPDQDKDKEEDAEISRVIDLFRAACAHHQTLCRNMMIGRGVDRHLFTLYVMARYRGVESPFLQRVLSEPWRLSTSQTATSQLALIDTVRFPEMKCPGGGFGPVADDGYGISYIIHGDDSVYFHVSSRRSCTHTDSQRFSRAIWCALIRIRRMFEPEWKPTDSPLPTSLFPDAAAVTAAAF